MKYYIFFTIGFIISSISSGCTLREKVKPRLIDTIIIKNSTEKSIKKVTISGSNGRTGSISPLPIGVEQIYGRGSRVKPLAESLNIHWIDATGKVYTKSLSTTSYLDASLPNTRKTLIFELMPYGIIKVSRE